MQKGQLVSIAGERRKGVLLPVTKADIKRGINALKPGLYVFSGYWHGRDPLSTESYGKIMGQAGKVVGRIRNHFQAKHVLA